MRLPCNEMLLGAQDFEDPLAALQRSFRELNPKASPEDVAQFTLGMGKGILQSAKGDLKSLGDAVDLFTTVEGLCKVDRFRSRVQTRGLQLLEAIRQGNKIVLDQFTPRLGHMVRVARALVIETVNRAANLTPFEKGVLAGSIYYTVLAGLTAEEALRALRAGEPEKVIAELEKRLIAEHPNFTEAQRKQFLADLLEAGKAPKAEVVPGAESRLRPPQFGPRWQARQITDPACKFGCENAAAQINKHIGGEIRHITPPAQGAFLGKYRGHDLGWHEHVVVVRDGRVYDAFTGHQGLSISEYKALWKNADLITFGF